MIKKCIAASLATIFTASTVMISIPVSASETKTTTIKKAQLLVRFERKPDYPHRRRSRFTCQHYEGNVGRIDSLL